MSLRLTRRAWLAAGFGGFLGPAQPIESLSVSWDGDSLRVAAPQLRFITGKPLERLKDGAAVTYLAQISLSLDGNATVHARAIDRFVVSYDLWEEKFSVTKMGEGRRSASRLSPAAAEAWCLDNLSLNSLRLTPERQFWLRLDVRTEDPKEATSVVGETGINLTRLVEIFSRPASSQQPHWTLSAGPLRLKDMKRNGRGTRGA